MWLGRRLAQNGFIVAAVSHHGNTAAETTLDPRGFRLFWERPVDLSRVLDRILTHPTFGPAVDPERVTAAGFSLGGYTVLALAGARVDLAAFEVFCAGPDRDATCEPQAEFPEAGAEFEALIRTDPFVPASLARHDESYRDSRVTAVVALAPFGSALTAESLEKVQVPVQIIVGDQDETTPPATNGLRIADAIPRARTVVLPGVRHYTFLNPCTLRGRWFVPVCREQLGVSRAEVHAIVGRTVVEFLQAVGDPGQARARPSAEDAVDLMYN